MHNVPIADDEMKACIVLAANRLALAGLSCLALAMVGVTMLITDFLFGTTTTVIATGVTVLIFAAVWYAIPLRRRL